VHIEDWLNVPIVIGPLKVLGKPGEHDTEIHAILAEYGLPSEFPIEVETMHKIDTSDYRRNCRNRDMRDTLTLPLIQRC
jgi:ribonuclease R